MTIEITLPPFDDIDDDGKYTGNDINFLIKNTMETNDALKQILETPWEELPRRTTFKSELFLLQKNEFDNLRKHISISDLSIDENNWDTIIIGNKIFKKQKL
jgi:hypothetical protein